MKNKYTWFINYYSVYVACLDNQVHSPVRKDKHGVEGLDGLRIGQSTLDFAHAETNLGLSHPPLAMEICKYKWRQVHLLQAILIAETWQKLTKSHPPNRAFTKKKTKQKLKKTHNGSFYCWSTAYFCHPCDKVPMKQEAILSREMCCSLPTTPCVEVVVCCRHIPKDRYCDYFYYIFIFHSSALQLCLWVLVSLQDSVSSRPKILPQVTWYVRFSVADLVVLWSAVHRIVVGCIQQIHECMLELPNQSRLKTSKSHLRSVNFHMCCSLSRSCVEELNINLANVWPLICKTPMLVL